MKTAWENPPADVLVVSGTLDELAIEHVRHRLRVAYQSCEGMRYVGRDGPYKIADSHLVFENAKGVRATIKPFSDSLTVIVSAPAFTSSLKMPPDMTKNDALGIIQALVA